MARRGALLLLTAIMATVIASAARASSSLTVWTLSTAYKAQPTTAPGAGTAVIMGGARGAYEAYQIVVHAGSSALSGVNMTASALSDGNGHTIAASSVTFYLETMIDLTGVALWPDQQQLVTCRHHHQAEWPTRHLQHAVRGGLLAV